MSGALSEKPGDQPFSWPLRVYYQHTDAGGPSCCSRSDSISGNLRAATMSSL